MTMSNADNKEVILLTEAEFASIRPLLNISSDRIEMAYRVLVQGQGYAEVGRQFSKDRQFVYKTTNVVRKTYQKLQKGLEDAIALKHGVREE